MACTLIVIRPMGTSAGLAPTLPALPGERAALVVAHPGHEVVLHGWLECARPSVFVLTDGSGQLGRSRLNSTSGVLARAGAAAGSIYGHFSDSEIYEAVLKKDLEVFIRTTLELARELTALRVDYVVGDSAEGYNPAHDLCRVILGAAVEVATWSATQPIENYEYVVTGRRDACVLERCDGAVRLRLGDEALRRKLSAALHYDELAAEVEAAKRRDGVAAYAVECLHRVRNDADWAPTGVEKPYYEHHGEGRVASGKYRSAIRYHAHMRPLIEALRHAVVRRGGDAPGEPAGASKGPAPCVEVSAS